MPSRRTAYRGRLPVGKRRKRGGERRKRRMRMRTWRRRRPRRSKNKSKSRWAKKRNWEEVEGDKMEVSMEQYNPDRNHKPLLDL